MALLFAATYPERISALVLYAAFARAAWAPDLPWGVRPDEQEVVLSLIESTWGTAASLPLFCPSAAANPAFRERYARFERMAVSPAGAAALLRMDFAIDVRVVLPSVRAPTLILHRTGDRVLPIEHARFLAERICGSRLVELSGDDHDPATTAQADEIADEIQRFLTGAGEAVGADDLETEERMRARSWIARAQADYGGQRPRGGSAGDEERVEAFVSAARATARELGMKALEEDLSGLRESSSAVRADAPTGTEPLLAPIPSASEAATPPMPRAPLLDASVLREGDYWSLSFEGRILRLKDMRGIDYIARLLASPGVEIPAMDLVRGDPDPRDGTAVPATGDLPVGGLGDAGEVLDAKSRSAYRRRLEELRGELDEAVSFNDIGRQESLRREVEFLGGELAAGIGLGGRSRRASSAAERARLSATRGILRAIRKIAGQDPSLGRYLETTIRTGTFCCHTPDPRIPVRWKL